MNILLEQFLIEGRECLEAMSSRLLELERAPDDAELLDDLFRRMHTLKGNSGLFPDLRDFIHVVHAGEDVLDALREGSIRFGGGMADILFESLDLISRMLDRIGEVETLGEEFHGDAERVVTALRELLARELLGSELPGADTLVAVAELDHQPLSAAPAWFTALPDAVMAQAQSQAAADQRQVVTAACYQPEPDCFFKGEDPVLLVRHAPGLAGIHTEPVGPWPDLSEFDPYRSNLRFTVLSTEPEATLREHFRYVEEQVEWYCPPVGGNPASAKSTEISWPDTNAELLAASTGAADPVGGITSHPGEGARDATVSEDERAALVRILAAQTLLLVPGDAATRNGRWSSAAHVAVKLATRLGADTMAAVITSALQRALVEGEATPLAAAIIDLEAILDGLDTARAVTGLAAADAPGAVVKTSAASAHPVPGPGPRPKAGSPGTPHSRATPPGEPLPAPEPSPAGVPREASVEPVRGEDEHAAGESGPRVLRVRQEKIDRLMDLVGEMVVAKNALPYLAAKAEGLSGARELAREIKAHYQVINRISEELQDSIMQVRMLPVSSVFQRFPRLVRDVSRKLGKTVQLEVVGEETEADKNIIESLADPLIHILRNSLDHGIELPAVRQAAGKPATGTIRIQAYQESDRVIIEISDDGRGIDPELVKRKAYERGLVDEARLMQISDQEAIQLVFAAGFSTNDTVSELSGRGVGMDVVRRAIERVNGTVTLDSQTGHGTRIKVVLPLSMAVTSVMLVRSAGQAFGLPMDLVVETVRVARTAIHTIKNQRAVVLRGRIVPLFALNDLLGMPVAQQLNADDELAVLVARIGGEHIGVAVDDFDETLDIILKPLDGVLAGLGGYAGTALLGDGSVLMVLNIKELL